MKHIETTWKNNFWLFFWISEIEKSQKLKKNKNRAIHFLKQYAYVQTLSLCTFLILRDHDESVCFYPSYVSYKLYAENNFKQPKVAL